MFHNKMDIIFNCIKNLNNNYSLEYDCGDGSFMLLYVDINYADFEQLKNNIEISGFSLYDFSIIESCQYFVYVKENITATISFCTNQMCLICDPYRVYYQTKLIKSGKFTTSLWQYEVDHSLIDCGMCYIIRCDDGSFCVIDSAHQYSFNDDQRIVDFLKKISCEEKPRVSAWFFTHAHEDHIGKFVDIARYHANEIDIDCLYYNFPSLAIEDSELWGTPLKNGIEIFRNIVKDFKKIKLHSGMNICVKNLKFQVLCTHEDIVPAVFSDFNNTSSVLMLEAEGTKISFPGDASAETDRVLIERYVDALKADIVQISHHGHSGASPDFYKRTNAKCALFPVTQIKFDEELSNQESNRVAIEIADEYFISSNGTVQIDLPYRVGKVTVYPDETFEDFAGIFNLWCYEYTDERKKQLYEEFLSRQ